MFRKHERGKICLLPYKKKLLLKLCLMILAMLSNLKLGKRHSRFLHFLKIRKTNILPSCRFGQYNSDNYIVIINLEASSLWQYYRVEQALNAAGDVIDFPEITIVLLLN